MAKIERHPRPPLWPSPAVWTDIGQFMLLAFTQDSAPVWEVHRKDTQAGNGADTLDSSGGADTFEAAKAAALFEARQFRPP